jgi:ABC-type multidrug transport system ATPase subunit
MNADIIFVVSDGKVAEQGSHEELLSKKGKYSDLWSKQIFFKPKELRAEQAGPQVQENKTASESPAEDTEDFQANREAMNSAKIKKEATQRPKLITSPDTPLSTKPNGVAATTPKGHRKEVDRSNNSS